MNKLHALRFPAISILTVMALLLTACGPAGTPTATQAPQPTENEGTKAPQATTLPAGVLQVEDGATIVFSGVVVLTYPQRLVTRCT